VAQIEKEWEKRTSCFFFRSWNFAEKCALAGLFFRSFSIATFSIFRYFLTCWFFGDFSMFYFYVKMYLMVQVDFWVVIIVHYIFWAGQAYHFMFFATSAFMTTMWCNGKNSWLPCGWPGFNSRHLHFFLTKIENGSTVVWAWDCRSRAHRFKTRDPGSIPGQSCFFFNFFLCVSCVCVCVCVCQSGGMIKRMGKYIRKCALCVALTIHWF